MRTHANYSIVAINDQFVATRDDGPWDQYPTITNDAEWVVKSLASTLGGRRLAYYDSEGQLDELLVKDGAFAGFAPLREHGAFV